MICFVEIRMMTILSTIRTVSSSSESTAFTSFVFSNNLLKNSDPSVEVSLLFSSTHLSFSLSSLRVLSQFPCSPEFEEAPAPHQTLPCPVVSCGDSNHSENPGPLHHHPLQSPLVQFQRLPVVVGVGTAGGSQAPSQRRQ